MHCKKELSAAGLRVPVLLSALLLLLQNSGVQGQDLPASSGPQTDQTAAGEQQQQTGESTAVKGPTRLPDAIPKHVSPPARGLEPEIRVRLEKLLDTSSEGLVEEEINGAVRLDLRGRFRTVPVATINEKGEVEITDYTHLPQEQ
jgi:hypothetical protein